MTRMLVFCDDTSHCVDPIGPIITDPHLVIPDDVFIADEFMRETILAADDYVWIRKSFDYRRDERRFVDDGTGAVREIVDDGTVLPPLNYQTEAQQRLSSHGRTRGNWARRCEARVAGGGRCGQRGGRWKAGDLDAVFTQLCERGIIGVSLRTLDLKKHTNR
jgi:hypothetical protein